MTDPHRRAAEALLDDLFTSSIDERVDRLVLMAGGIDLGGWGRAALLKKLLAYGAQCAAEARAEVEKLRGDLHGIQARAELNRLVELVRFTPGQSSGFMHSPFQSEEMLWKWAQKWGHDVTLLAAPFSARTDAEEPKP